MDQSGFAHLAELVRNRAGIALPAEKSHATIRRLAPVARMFGFSDSASLLAELAHPREELAQAVTEAVTVQDTSFFRDPLIFQHVKTAILPELIDARRQSRRIRIWSAGCATGQEAYSLAMILDELNLASGGWMIDLIATDLSGDAIARAKDGLYSSYEIQRGLAPELVSRYFVEDRCGWRAIERLRRAIAFRTFNLLDHFGWLAGMDVIVCRNVFLYLAPEEKPGIVGKMARILAADGCLVLGEAEGSAAKALPFMTPSGPRGVFTKQ
ncbi:MAG: protein-glutamate O-methyltransferase CheR [Rhizomicrobium sp.]|jgi:chemotaxis protein methyltransferase CheR